MAVVHRDACLLRWRGNAFEIACLCHIQQLKHAIGISAVQAECFPWMSSESDPGVQVDLVIERADKVTNLCEMKYTDDEFSIDKECEDDLRRKGGYSNRRAGPATLFC